METVSKTRKPNRIALIVVCTLATAVVGTAAPAQAAPRWAPASKATLHPVVQTRVGGTRCTANFVFYDSRYVYLGSTAECSGPPGTKVTVQGASRSGKVVYNSWSTSGAGANNFALVRLDNADKARVNPSVPFWGGPTAGGGASSFGRPVYAYGNSASPSATTDRSPKYGIDTSTELPGVCFFRPECGADGWTHYAQMVLPATSHYYEGTSRLGGDDLGSPVLDARGRAFGILGPWAHDTSNRVTDLARAVRHMKAYTNLDAIRLAKGTEPFLPSL